MFNSNMLLERLIQMLKLSEQKFNESQELRMEYILYAKNSGDYLLQFKEELKGATRYSPKELEGIGSFTSFNNFLQHVAEQCGSGFKVSTLKDYVTLAENWDIVLALGMQDRDNVDKLKNAMRVGRTLRIIRWYKRKVKDGSSPAELTLDLYWLEQEGTEQEGSSAPSYRELQRVNRELQQEVMSLREEVTALKHELSKKQPAPASSLEYLKDSLSRVRVAV